MLKQIRANYKNEETASLLKQSLYNKLKECRFTTLKQHVKLTFEVKFKINDLDDNFKTVALCESCYATFNDHICKYITTTSMYIV